jgi:hypothetical protein
MPSAFVKTAEPFACGGSAATFASCVIHPMDLAKVCRNANSHLSAEGNIYI